MVKGANSYWRPIKNSSVGHMPVKFPANQPPTIPRAILNIIKKGLMKTAAHILGNTNYEAELIPITSKASICSVTRIVPIDDAICDPILPAKIRLIIVGENSKIIESLLANPIK